MSSRRVTVRRGTTAAHVLDQLGSPLPRAARLEHKRFVFQGGSTLNPNIKRNSRRPQKASLEPPEESGEAYFSSGRVAGTHPFHETAAALSALCKRREERRAQRFPWGVEELPATLLRRAAQQ